MGACWKSANPTGTGPLGIVDSMMNRQDLGRARAKYGRLAREIGAIIVLLSALACGGGQKKQSSGGENEGADKLVQDLGQIFDGGEVIPTSLRRAYVYNVRNRSFQGQIGQELTNRLVLELEKRGRLLLVENPKDAHVLIYTTLEHYKKIPIAWDPLGRPTSVSMFAVAEVKVRQNSRPGKPGKPGKVLVEKTPVEARLTYATRGMGAAAELEARYRLMDQMAARVALTAETGWYTELKTDRELGKKQSGKALLGGDEAENETETTSVGEKPLSEKTEEEEIEELEKKSLDPEAMEEEAKP